MLRLFGILATACLALGTFLVLDYNLARQQAAKDDPVALTVQEYLDSLPARFSRPATASSAPQGLPTRLSAMLPLPPEGWTVRTGTADDLQGFLPAGGAGDRAALGLLAELAPRFPPHGSQTVLLAYENGDRRVLVQAIRHPDAIFTDPAFGADRLALRTREATFRPLPLMTVRGLDVTEDILPRPIRARLLMADVGGQIHLRMLAPGRMRDAELMAFFATLNVAAMNASVVLTEDGLGAVPQIVLASALEDTARAAYEADRAARADARRLRARVDLAGPASAGADPVAATPADRSDCVQDAKGVKRCIVRE